MPQVENADMSPAPYEGDPEDLLGKRVLVVGLLRQPEFNGEWGRVESYDAGLQRFVVRVLRDAGPPSGVLAKLRRENLLAPPTVALKFDEEPSAKSGQCLDPTLASSQSQWLAEPAFVPSIEAPIAEQFLADREASLAAASLPSSAPLLLPHGGMSPGCDCAAEDLRLGAGSSPLVLTQGGGAASDIPQTVLAQGVAPNAQGKESPEKWKPTLRHWWGDSDLDSSGTVGSGPRGKG
jgi:hypothetical protein